MHRSLTIRLMSLLKLHSYPYFYMVDKDEGRTAVTMSSKNHAGSIKGTPEIHKSYIIAASYVEQDQIAPGIPFCTESRLSLIFHFFLNSKNH